MASENLAPSSWTLAIASTAAASSPPPPLRALFPMFAFVGNGALAAVRCGCFWTTTASSSELWESPSAAGGGDGAEAAGRALPLAAAAEKPPRPRPIPLAMGALARAGLGGTLAVAKAGRGGGGAGLRGGALPVGAPASLRKGGLKVWLLLLTIGGTSPSESEITSGSLSTTSGCGFAICWALRVAPQMRKPSASALTKMA
mmetsp:Transcript_63283/g.136038  ORF Transcript_63283/g.136038 Transcript_63283/m.136038 type:complete len:201 (-) Transcript_63283:3-605(-)